MLVIGGRGSIMHAAVEWDLEDLYGLLVTSTDNTGKSQGPAVAFVPVD